MRVVFRLASLAAAASISITSLRSAPSLAGTSGAEVLETTQEMKSAALEFAGPGGPAERLRNLQLALFDPQRFTFEYESQSTLTAREAFETRRGNCVAFTSLFIALARAAEIPVSAGLVRRAVGSSQEGDLVLVRNHVVAVMAYGGRYLLYDFSRFREDVVGKVRMLTDDELAGVAVGNRAIASLQSGDLPGALADQRLAVALAPGLASMHGNLGVLLYRGGDPRGAAEAYRQALELEPHTPAVIQNLAMLFRSEGRSEAARGVLAALDAGAASPHTLLVIGDLQMAAGRVPLALDSYRRAHRLAPDSVTPLLAIAKAEMALGESSGAKRTLERARRVAPANEDVTMLLASLGAPSTR